MPNSFCHVLAINGVTVNILFLKAGLRGLIFDGKCHILAYLIFKVNLVKFLSDILKKK